MVVVQVNGGLGNQMFQYAYGFYLAKKTGKKLFIDTKLLDYYPFKSQFTRRKFELHIFNLSGETICIRSSLIKLLLKNSFLFKFYNFIIFSLKNFEQVRFVDLDRIYKDNTNYFLDGHFQSYKYLDFISSDIRNEFVFDLDNFHDANSIELLNTRNSISIHIRRSDYLNKNNSDIHGVLSLDYYIEAIRYITDRVDYPHFYIFSDDVDWVTENLKLNYPFTVIDNNTGSDSYKDMALMSMCDHNIIANSTFSWWGAWLNNNDLKIVIAPKQWFKSKVNFELLCPNWIKI